MSYKFSKSSKPLQFTFTPTLELFANTISKTITDQLPFPKCIKIMFLVRKNMGFHKWFYCLRHYLRISFATAGALMRFNLNTS
jgi:hypothetical protein